MSDHSEVLVTGSNIKQWWDHYEFLGKELERIKDRRLQLKTLIDAATAYAEFQPESTEGE